MPSAHTKTIVSSTLLVALLAGAAVAGPPTPSRDSIRAAPTGPIVLAQATSSPAMEDGRRRPGDVFRDRLADGGDCGEGCPEMVVVPAGSFVMGSPTREAGRFDNEGPQRQVSVRPRFAVGRFEVTFAEWDACVAAGGCGGHVAADQGWGRKTLPVVDVGLADAEAYVAWLKQRTGKSYRLPSEAEWEYAARGIVDGRSGSRFAWGDGMQIGLANCLACGGDAPPKRTTVGGDFPPNAFGLFDMAGNVAEWTADPWHDDFTGAPTDAKPWVAGGDAARRAVRGGSWRSTTREVRAAVRVAAPKEQRSDSIGFRVVRDLDPS